MADQDIALVARLMRRAGFGASRDEIEAKAAQGYDNVVQGLLNPTGGVDDDILMRYNPAYYEPGAIEVNTQLWVLPLIGLAAWEICSNQTATEKTTKTPGLRVLDQLEFSTF